MKTGDIVKHCKLGYTGVIISINNGYAEILLTYPGMYNPEYYHIKDLEVINEVPV